MKIIKGILKEQLKNAIQLKEDYQRELKKLGRGVIVKKRISNNYYYYNEYRSGNKVIFDYLGKLIPAQVKILKNKQKMRKRYKDMIKELDKQICFFQKTLKTKEAKHA